MGGMVHAHNGRAFLLLFAVLSSLLLSVWNVPAMGEMWRSLTQNPTLYTLSLGHMADLTLKTFAFLKPPLGLAALAFGLGACGLWFTRRNTRSTALVLAGSMVVFFQASRLALVRFENYLGSYPLAVALEKSPPGQLIEADAYYAFSSVFFYTNRTALLVDGRVDNLEYGSYAPDAPRVFIDDHQFVELWEKPELCYLLTYGSELPHFQAVVGKDRLHVVAVNSGNYLLSNQSFSTVQTPHLHLEIRRSASAHSEPLTHSSLWPVVQVAISRQRLERVLANAVRSRTANALKARGDPPPLAGWQ